MIIARSQVLIKSAFCARFKNYCCTLKRTLEQNTIDCGSIQRRVTTRLPPKIHKWKEWIWLKGIHDKEGDECKLTRTIHKWKVQKYYQSYSTIMLNDSNLGIWCLPCLVKPNQREIEAKKKVVEAEKIRQLSKHEQVVRKLEKAKRNPKRHRR